MYKFVVNKCEQQKRYELFSNSPLFNIDQTDLTITKSSSSKLITNWLFVYRHKIYKKKIEHFALVFRIGVLQFQQQSLTNLIK